VISEVWTFVPSVRASGDVDRVRTNIQMICRKLGWRYQERKTTQVQGRTLISGEDVRSVYQRMHRTRVAILSVQAPKAQGPHFLSRPLPLRPPAAIHWRDAVSLRRLCRHKAFFLRLRWDRDATAWASAFSAWATRIECAGANDPRCLPLHVFAAKRWWSRKLTTEEGRAAFDDQYGAGARRVDDRSLEWQTGPNHGREILHIAGCNLPTGFHWDVQGSEVEVWTPTEGWLIRKYVNISPDADVRGREPYAKKIPLR
jgi:hypothetical protein